MRNIFDQYSQPENRLTHALASALHQDRSLLKSFVRTFGPNGAPALRQLTVTEQSLPGRPEPVDGERESRGLPDALIHDDEGWALVIESKVMDSLTRDQLRRHQRTIERCGFETISGIAITVRAPGFSIDGWRMLRWKDVYAWAVQKRTDSQWAGFLVDYFNIAEAKMAAREYLKEGTITEFAGISLDPYTYLEAKRVLRLLTQKLRDNKAFMKDMRLDPATRRANITEQARLWDFISFKLPDGTAPRFDKFPHCTVGIGPDDAEAMLTFPNGMSPTLRKSLCGDSFEQFADRLEQASASLTGSLGGFQGYRPIIRIMQRRYKSQSAVPLRDGFVEFDLRTVSGGDDPMLGRPVKEQREWARMAYDLLANKHSNIQFQIGVLFDYLNRPELARKDADRYFAATFKGLRRFATPVID